MKKRIFSLVWAICILFGTAFADTLRLPQNLSIIEAEAFYGDMALDIVIVPDGTRIIRNLSFAYSSLQEIHLPESLTSIAGDAFEGCENLTVYGKANGKVQDWCKQNNVSFIPSTPLGTLTMATDANFPPYEYYDDNTGNLVGIDVEIASAICNELHYELKILDMDFDSILIALAAGKADFAMAALIETEERRNYADFTNIYHTGIQQVLTRSDSVFDTADDIRGSGVSCVIGVKANSTGDLYCGWEFENDSSKEIMRFSTFSDAISALVAGRLDCVVMDGSAAQNYLEENDNLKILNGEFSREEFVIAVQKDSVLLDSFNAALQKIHANGTLQNIIDKYIVEPL